MVDRIDGRPGPGSVTWRYASDSRASLLAPAALILQVAHPVVGAGVSQHSAFMTAQWSRLLRTLQSTNRLIFGHAESAAAESARLRRIHAGIRGVDAAGHPYRALDPDVYAWVHLTLAHAYVEAQRLLGRTPSPAQVDQFYAEWRQVGTILRVEAGQMPPDWPAFQVYFDRMVAETLGPNPALRDVLAALACPGRPVPLIPELLWRPAARAAGYLTYGFALGTLPSLLRGRLGVEWTAFDQRRFECEAALLRTAFALTPAPLRTAPLSMPHLVRARLRQVA
jgi:uncharacterized protein (DUF2236 family)